MRMTYQLLRWSCHNGRFFVNDEGEIGHENYSSKQHSTAIHLPDDISGLATIRESLRSVQKRTLINDENYLLLEKVHLPTRLQRAPNYSSVSYQIIDCLNQTCEHKKGGHGQTWAMGVYHRLHPPTKNFQFPPQRRRGPSPPRKIAGKFSTGGGVRLHV